MEGFLLLAAILVIAGICYPMVHYLFFADRDGDEESFDSNSAYRLEVVQDDDRWRLRVRKLEGSGYWSSYAHPWIVTTDTAPVVGMWAYDFCSSDVVDIATGEGIVVSANVRMGNGLPDLDFPPSEV